MQVSFRTIFRIFVKSAYIIKLQDPGQRVKSCRINLQLVRMEVNGNLHLIDVTDLLYRQNQFYLFIKNFFEIKKEISLDN